jgi:glyoxylase-like metal-dependent hydrolase (beta-lactamase superfamily II)
MQITKHVYQVGGSGFSHPSDAAIYLIRDEMGTALVDAGTGEGHERVIRNIRDHGIDPGGIEYLFLTHCHYDHTGGAQHMRDETGSLIVAHELDAAYLEAGDPKVTAAAWYGSSMEPLSIDISVKESEREFTIGNLGITMYHIPGHSPGSIALTLYSEGKLVLFGQDVHGPLNEVLLSEREDYIRSLEFLISLEADILCEGHFGVYEGRGRVKRFIESFL